MGNKDFNVDREIKSTDLSNQISGFAVINDDAQLLVKCKDGLVRFLDITEIGPEDDLIVFISDDKEAIIISALYYYNFEKPITPDFETVGVWKDNKTKQFIIL